MPRLTTSILAAAVLTFSAGAQINTCDLYPIAVSAHAISNATTGASIDLLNGAQPGNFGWLTWGGSPSEPTLARSLTAPGDSNAYVNPDDTRDRQVNIGDWIHGRPGVSNSKQLRDALEALKSIDVIVPVWDATRGQGDSSAYRVSGFARVRLVSYNLPQQNRITAQFLGTVPCGVQNTAPAVDAGPDQSIQLPATVTLTAAVADDGLPIGSTLSVVWTQLGGAGTVTFGNSNAASITAAFSTAGTYGLRVTASDGELSSSDDVIVTVDRENRPPVAFGQSLLNEEGSRSPCRVPTSMAMR